MAIGISALKRKAKSLNDSADTIMRLTNAINFNSSGKLNKQNQLISDIKLMFDSNSYIHERIINHSRRLAGRRLGEFKEDGSEVRINLNTSGDKPRYSITFISRGKASSDLFMATEFARLTDAHKYQTFSDEFDEDRRIVFFIDKLNVKATMRTHYGIADGKIVSCYGDKFVAGKIQSGLDVDTAKAVIKEELSRLNATRIEQLVEFSRLIKEKSLLVDNTNREIQKLNGEIDKINKQMDAVKLKFISEL